MSYLAPERARLITAVYGLFGGDPDSDFGLKKPLWGVYASLSQCFEALEARSTDYRTETGLTPIASTCDKAMHGGYSLRIDGAGAPSRRFYSAQPEFHGAADGKLAQEVSRLTELLGGHVRNVTPWGRYVVTQYYATRPLGLNVRTIGFEGQVNSASECAAELAQTVRVMTELHDGATPAIARCLKDGYDTSYHLNFVPPLDRPTAKYFEVEGPEYASYVACAGDRERIVDLMRAQTARDFRGAVCVRVSSVDPMTFQLTLVGI